LAVDAVNDSLCLNDGLTQIANKNLSSNIDVQSQAGSSSALPFPGGARAQREAPPAAHHIKDQIMAVFFQLMCDMIMFRGWKIGHRR